MMSKKAKRLFDRINDYVVFMEENGLPIPTMKLHQNQYDLLDGKHPRIKLEVIK